MKILIGSFDIEGGIFEDEGIVLLIKLLSLVEP